MNSKRHINNYMKNISNELCCNKSIKKTLLKDIRAAVNDFAENNNITDEQQLTEHFGTPEEIAKVFLVDVNLKDLKRKAVIRKLLIIIMAFLITILAVFLVDRLIASYKSVNGFSVVSKLEIVNTTESTDYYSFE